MSPLCPHRAAGQSVQGLVQTELVLFRPSGKNGDPPAHEPLHPRAGPRVAPHAQDRWLMSRTLNELDLFLLVPQAERKQGRMRLVASSSTSSGQKPWVCVCPPTHSRTLCLPKSHPPTHTSLYQVTAAEAPGGWHPNPQLRWLLTWLWARLHTLIISKDVT